MKKLLSVLGSLLVVAPSVSAVVSCGIETNPVKFKVDGKDEFKIANEKVGFQKLFGSVATLPILANLVLESLSFTESKYIGEKKNEAKTFLGEKGIAMSLEKIFNDGPKDFIEFIDNSQDDNDNDNFQKYYEAPINSNFVEINYDLGIEKSELASENDKWSASKASVYKSEKVLTMNTKIEYKDGKVQKIEENQNENPKNLKDYIELTWEKTKYKDYFNSGDFTKYKDKKIYNMSETEAKELYTKIKDSGSDKMKEDLGVNKLSQDQFKVLHTQLNKVDEKFKNGILMPGKFEKNFSQTKASFIKSSEGNPVEERKDISEGVNFYTTNDGKSMQAQVVGFKENNKRTFIYGKSDEGQQLSIDFLFNVPKDNKYSPKEKNYIIRLTLENLFVGYQLNGITLEKGFDDKDKKREDEVIYWYEPSIYQFTNEEIFKPGNSNVFKDLKKVKLEIEKEK
ncbi:lipoprotein [Spiroplasma cantharicola]|uniref:Lipoprotein n=1 Tax=Spiroplasma cantharicola TaxID=362837 RepID=A0A0M4JIS4_9MOLU|nr:lipoprotein [Spiroplasma cantharicola]ALD65936.1 hypothetical protein SCANT_v1c00260 [Spiroplasma cantharicola]